MHKYFLIILILFFYSCKNRNNISQVQVKNGVETQQFPGIVQYHIWKLLDVNKAPSWVSCTGSFITSRVMLTAAHCLQSLTNENFSEVKVRYNNIETNLFFVKKGYKEARTKNDLELVPDDLAMVSFPQDMVSVKDTLPIAMSPIKHREKFLMIGYGANDGDLIEKDGKSVLFETGSGTKRIGHNYYFYNHFLENGMVVFNGADENLFKFDVTKEYAATGGGDSGSPLLVEQRGIVGICSAGTNRTLSEKSPYEIAVNYHHLLATESNVEFFKQAISEGFLPENILNPTDFDVSISPEEYEVKRDVLGRVLMSRDLKLSSDYMRGEDVMVLQYVLKKSLGASITIDGVFGPGSVKAVKSAQEYFEFEKTGIANKALYEHLKLRVKYE